MRLRKLHIMTGYKNLKDFNLYFDDESFIDVFVGKNGTGKSNLFEAIIEIFRFLDRFKKGSSEIDFDFSIEYEIDGKSTNIKWSGGTLSINKSEDRKTLGKTPFPDNVLVYYSGHNSKVAEIVNNYERSFKKTIKNADIDKTRKIIGIGREYKQLLLTVLLIQKRGMDQSPGLPAPTQDLTMARQDLLLLQQNSLPCTQRYRYNKMYFYDNESKAHRFHGLGEACPGLIEKACPEHAPIAASSPDPGSEIPGSPENKKRLM